MRKRVGSVILMLLPIHGAVLAQPAAGPEKPDIEELIKQLGDDRWRVREAATRELSRIGQAALPANWPASGRRPSPPTKKCSA